MLNNLLVLTTKEYYICQGTKYKTQVWTLGLTHLIHCLALSLQLLHEHILIRLHAGQALPMLDSHFSFSHCLLNAFSLKLLPKFAVLNLTKIHLLLQDYCWPKHYHSSASSLVHDYHTITLSLVIPASPQMPVVKVVFPLGA